VRCHAGCRTDAVLAALGLVMRDLFPRGVAERQALGERAMARRRFRTTPRETAIAMLTREIERIAARLREQFGYDPPLRAAHLNEARERVSRILDICLAPIASFDWECHPHDDDPEWPALYSRAVEEEESEGFSPRHDPFARDRAVQRARRWQREMACLP
jgi:hypothetical protein